MAYRSYRLGGGLNTKAEPASIQDDQVTRARGCRYDTLGSIQSARGRTALYGSALSGAVLGTGELLKSDGTVARISKAATTIYEDTTSIATGWSSSGVLSAVSYNGYVYLTDGSNLKRWDGTAMAGWGLSAPASDPTAAGTGAGGALATAGFADGTYQYVYTFYNGVAESNFSDPVSVVVADDGSGDVDQSVHDAIRITVGLGPTGTTERRIYRTYPDSSDFFYLASVEDNSTTTYDDAAKLAEDADGTQSPSATITDAPRAPQPGLYNTFRRGQTYQPSTTLQNKFDRIRLKNNRLAAGEDPEVVMTNLGALADWTDHDPPPTGLKHVRFLKETIFGIEGNNLRFSKAAQPEHWPIYYSVPIGRQSGDTLLAVEPFTDNSVACYTDSGIYIFEQVGISPTDARLVKVEGDVGLAAEWAVASLANGVHLFLAKSGLYLLQGNQITEVSFPIEDLFFDSTHEDYINPDFMSSARMASHRDRVWMTYGKDSANDRVLFMDFQDPGNPKFSTKVDTLTWVAKEVKGNILIGGDASGYVYQMDTGTADNAAAIDWAVKTKDYALGDNDLAVQICSVVLDADLGGASTTVTLTADHGGTARTFSFTRSTAGRQRHVQKVPPTMKCETFNVSVSSSATADRALYGVGFEYEELGLP